ncbi:hypothetical protein T440DRAFT_500299 [Plenodomus tracheiphilus IPT5]|uniref:NACHT domain-containing protein n=1 Tax=Plenodomus tracheiphilus IPT5 TaxID=1408161 RepID=A0A6A7AZA6_9PLEO|nr:hypothetical protein T440DRAFT_500299 [Plenodomus tracheiphilus IPT5]
MPGFRNTLRKLKRKKLAPEKPSPQQQSSQDPIPATSRTKSYGLSLLSDHKLSDESNDLNGVDIVAIHGLNGDAYTTWQHENGTLWLRDLLPVSLPGSRVFTYGYPSELFWSSSVATLRDYSRNLLVSITTVSQEKQRPIVFVCHSLVGIVCKQALVLAHEDDRLYGDILSAVSGILFFGTPHRGSKGADIGKTVGNVVNMCLCASHIAGIAGSVRADLLTTLESNSEALGELAVSSRNRLRNLEIGTFHETQTMPGLSELVVEKHSAIMENPDEEIIPLYANHRTMCRFEGVTDNGYIYALRIIKRLAEKALKNREMSKKSNRTSSNQSLSEADKSCMVLLNSIHLAEYKAQLPKPVQGTCSWILTHPAYMSWIAAEGSGILWVTGEPGCGKTMLSAYLVDHLRSGRVESVRPQVFFFFCDDRVKSQRDGNAILRGILYQIIQQHRKFMKHVKSRFEMDGPSLATSFPALWELLLKIAADSPSGAIRIIVDAIDECEVRTHNSFLDAIMQLVNGPKEDYRQSQNCIKFLITSRPSLRNSYNITGFMKSRLQIEQSQNNISKDIKLVIRSKQYLEQVLYSKSDQNFLWLNLVLHSLETTKRASKNEFERIINTFPEGLEDTYSSFIRGISSEDREDAGKFFRLLIGGSRYLTLGEMDTAFTIDQEHKVVADLEKDSQFSISSTLQNIVGPLVSIKGENQSSNEDSKVSLIHQSAKEYLTELAPRSTDKIVQSFAVSLADAALSISQSCMRYLLLQDFRWDVFAPERTSLDSSSTISFPSFPFTEFDTADLASPFTLDDHLSLDDLFKDPQTTMDEERCTLIAHEYKFFDYAATSWAEHYSLCEHIAPKDTLESVHRLTAASSSVLTNWFRYYWIRKNMGYPFPGNFEKIELAAFFNLPKLLAKTLADADYENEAGKVRALSWAAKMSSLDSIRLLLQYGTNPNAVGLDRQTPLTIAAQYGHLDSVTILLNDPHTVTNLRGKSRRSALSFAAGNGHLEIVEALLESGAFRQDDQDDMTWTPIFWAVQGDYPVIVQLLLKQPSIDINQVDKAGRSVLSWASGEGNLGALKILLLHPSVDLNLKDTKGRSPLSWAAGNGKREVVSILMHKPGVDKATKDNGLRNAISWACQGGHTDTLRTLLKNKCTGEDDVDIDNWTPLLWALFVQSPRTVEVLLSTRRVQIDREDGYGRTALIWAASYGYLDVVQLLVSWGASLSIMDQRGQTAADVAKSAGQIEVWEFLETQRSKNTGSSVE